MRTESELPELFGCRRELDAHNIPYFPLPEASADVWPSTIRKTAINGVLVIGRPVYPDARGDFHETYRKSDIVSAVSFFPDFCQGNESRNIEAGVLRGLHIAPWWKLVACTAGEAFVVAVDARPTSPTFGKVHTERLDANNRVSILITPGAAHGYLTLAPGTTYAYQASEEYANGREVGINYQDPRLSITYPIEGPFSVSDKDANNPTLEEQFGQLVDFSKFPWLSK